MKKTDIGLHLIHATLAAALLGFAIFLIAVTVNAMRPARTTIPDADVALITSQLKAKSAGDCVIEEVPGGYRAVEMRTGKVYRIARN